MLYGLVSYYCRRDASADLLDMMNKPSCPESKIIAALDKPTAMELLRSKESIFLNHAICFKRYAVAIHLLERGATPRQLIYPKSLSLSRLMVWHYPNYVGTIREQKKFNLILDAHEVAYIPVADDLAALNASYRGAEAIVAATAANALEMRSLLAGLSPELTSLEQIDTYRRVVEILKAEEEAECDLPLSLKWEDSAVFSNFYARLRYQYLLKYSDLRQLTLTSPEYRRENDLVWRELQALAVRLGLWEELVKGRESRSVSPCSVRSTTVGSTTTGSSAITHSVITSVADRAPAPGLRRRYSVETQ